MLNQNKHSLGPLFCYHGCDRKIGEEVLTGNRSLKPSENEYDWLGTGIYFWVDSPRRAMEWAANSKANISNPFIIGAYILPGNCLNLTDYGTRDQLRDAYDVLVRTLENAGEDIPTNTVEVEGVYLSRHLDCAVINTLHQLREDSKQEPYQTVYGVFEEGGALYPGAGIKEKTHVQIAVKDPSTIVGYFRVPEEFYET